MNFGRIFAIGSFLVAGLTMLLCAVLVAADVRTWPWHGGGLNAWLDSAGKDIFFAYFLGGMGILVVSFAIGPLRQRVLAPIGEAQSDSVAGTFRFDMFGRLFSLIYRYLGILFLMIAALFAWANLVREQHPTAGTRALVIAIGAIFAIPGIFLAFIRKATIVDAASHSVIDETRIWLIVYTLTLRRTRPMSDYDRIRVQKVRVSGLTRTPPSVYCEVRLVEKSGGLGPVLISSREPSKQEGIAPDVLAFARGWSEATGLRLEIGAGAPDEKPQS
jgi:hypothetical protein